MVYKNNFWRIIIHQRLMMQYKIDPVKERSYSSFFKSSSKIYWLNCYSSFLQIMSEGRLQGKWIIWEKKPQEINFCLWDFLQEVCCPYYKEYCFRKWSWECGPVFLWNFVFFQINLLDSIEFIISFLNGYLELLIRHIRHY